MFVSHNTDKENLAIVFADICGNTGLYDNLGDAMARRLIARHRLHECCCASVFED